MKISRHARNNMKLYNISNKDIIKVIKLPDISEKEGIKMTAIKNFPNKFSGYPLKVVYERTAKELFVITVYTLKKKSWR